MSARAEKALRKEMRRAMGDGALSAVVELQNVLNNQVVPNLNAQTAAIAEHDKSIATLKARYYLGTLPAEVLHVDCTFARRLKWLFTGR